MQDFKYRSLGGKGSDRRMDDMSSACPGMSRQEGCRMDNERNGRGVNQRIIWILAICFLWLVTSAQTCKTPPIPFINAPIPLLSTEVLFDQGHGQKFSLDESGPRDLSLLAALVKYEGASVKKTREPLTEDVLSGVDTLVISGALSVLEPEEVDAITTFVNEGGGLCIMLHIAWPVSDLLNRLGVSISRGVVQEQENIIGARPLDFQVIWMEPHPITEGLRDFAVSGTWALLPRGENAKIIAQTSPSAWVDVDGNARLNSGDAMQSFGVVVAGEMDKGQFVVFGNNVMFQNRFLQQHNHDLAKNLARWLGN